jgi:NAD(P)-dependent dehydrogenase (short-subunit alcohol dehydrogenase family)
MKTIFITGTSSGIGKASAKLFASKGWNVIATMRNVQKDNELNQLKNITVLPLDITNINQIKNTVEKAIDIADIDVVFNNAGYFVAAPLEAISDEKMIQQFDTLLLGVIRITQAFIPHFRKNKKGLFITTTSIGGFITFPFGSLYHAAKWALEGWSECMAFELDKFGIGIKTVSPGTTKSDLMKNMEIIKHDAYKEQFDKYQNTMESASDADNASTPEQIAEVVYESATDGKDQLRYLAGEDAKAIYKRRLEIGDELFRKEINKMIFG